MYENVNKIQNYTKSVHFFSPCMEGKDRNNKKEFE